MRLPPTKPPLKPELSAPPCTTVDISQRYHFLNITLFGYLVSRFLLPISLSLSELQYVHSYSCPHKFIPQRLFSFFLLASFAHQVSAGRYYGTYSLVFNSNYRFGPGRQQTTITHPSCDWDLFRQKFDASTASKQARGRVSAPAAKGCVLRSYLI